MPKETFFNLKPDKKAIVLNAALKEFSQHSVQEASVANIVRDSEISRGSFYKYFEDIEDLYYYFYHHITQHAHGTVIEAIKNADGDLFKGLEGYLKELIHAFSDPLYHDYFKVLSLNLNYVTERRMGYQSQGNPHGMATKPEEFIEVIDTNSLNAKTNAELLTFFKVLVPVVHECLNDYFAKDWSEEQLMGEYRNRVKWLKFGIIHNE